MVALEFVDLTLSVFLRTFHYGDTTRNNGGRIKQAYEGRTTLVSRNKGIWTSLVEYGIVRV